MIKGQAQQSPCMPVVEQHRRHTVLSRRCPAGPATNTPVRPAAASNAPRKVYVQQISSFLVPAPAQPSARPQGRSNRQRTRAQEWTQHGNRAALHALPSPRAGKWVCGEGGSTRTHAPHLHGAHAQKPCEACKHPGLSLNDTHPAVGQQSPLQNPLPRPKAPEPLQG